MGDNKRRKVSYVRGVGIRRILREQSVSEDTDKEQVMSWGPKGQAVDGSGWVISFTLSFGLENSTQIKFDKEEEYQRALDSLNEKFNVIL